MKDINGREVTIKAERGYHGYGTRPFGICAPEDATARIAREHEARFAALPEDEQDRQYAKFEQGTAGAWLGTYSR